MAVALFFISLQPPVIDISFLVACAKNLQHGLFFGEKVEWNNTDFGIKKNPHCENKILQPSCKERSKGSSSNQSRDNSSLPIQRRRKS